MIHFMFRWRFLLLATFCFLSQHLGEAFSVDSTVSNAYSSPHRGRPLFLFGANNNGAINGATARNKKIPYVIEVLPERPNEKIFADIAHMCINAFFNDQTSSKGNSKNPPWKELQLSHLRRLQSTDLTRRRRRDVDTNCMLVARRVIPATAKRNHQMTPLILDLSQVHNLPSSSETNKLHMDWVRDEVLGFVEVTRRPYGLDHEPTRPRPILTNLSVTTAARNSGIGSRLMETVERLVVDKWQESELILEVESDNIVAQEFYQNRGYDVCSEDPASRRYDLSGVWLKEVRCRRLIMRKELAVNLPLTLLQKFTNNVKSLAEAI